MAFYIEFSSEHLGIYHMNCNWVQYLDILYGEIISIEAKSELTCYRGSMIFFFCLFAISWATPAAHGDSQARGLIGAVAAGQQHSHSNVGSEPRPPQLMAMLDP